MVKILVVGGSGLVGAHLMRSLARLGECVGTTFSRSGRDLMRLDIRDAGAVERLISAGRYDVVVCVAAEAHVDLCEREPQKTRAINVEGTRNVVDAAAKHGSQIVFTSSDYVFDGTAGPYSEDDRTCPLNEYGRQKVDAERIVSSAEGHLILRISGVYGTDERRRNFVCQVVDRLRSGQPVTAAMDQRLCPTWANPLAEAVAELLRLGIGGLCNVVGPETLTRFEFARRIATGFGFDPNLVAAVPSSALLATAPRPSNSALSDARLRSVLGHGLTSTAEALAELKVAGL